MPRPKKPIGPAVPPVPSLDANTRETLRLKARHVVAALHLTRSDQDDVEQDLTLHVWQRLGRFRPGKAAPDAFVRMLVGHATATILRGRTRAARRAPTSLEAVLRPEGEREPVDPRSHHAEEQQALALDLAAVLATLPRKLRRVADSLRTQSVTVTARRLGLSRAEVYRRLARLRQAFTAVGLNIFSDQPPDTSNSAGVVT